MPIISKVACAVVAFTLLAGCSDTTAPIANSKSASPNTSLLAFDCVGSGSAGLQCAPSALPLAAAAASLVSASASPSNAPAFDKIVGTPYAALAQTAFDYGVSGPNQLRSTIALKNLTVQPFATNADFATYDGVGAQVFFSAGPTNTGGTPGPVTLVNPDGTTGTFTASNQSFYTYAEQLPANATNATPKQWIFQLPDATTTFSFQVYVSVAFPDESTPLQTAHTFTSLGTGIDGFSTCGIRTGGTAYCWGQNTTGQLGNGTTANKNVPVGILSTGPDVTQIGWGVNSTCALTSAGQIYCWGRNQYGQLGFAGDFATHSTPVAVTLPAGVTGFTAVAESGSHTCAVANTAQVYCWGANQAGQLGSTTNNGTSTANPTPQTVALPAGVDGFTSIAGGLEAGYGYTCALANTAQLYCWGSNRVGQLGTSTNVGTITPNPDPLLVALPSGVTSFSAVATGGGQTCAIADTGVLFCWGSNNYGQLGDSANAGTSTPTPTPRAVPFPSGVTSFSTVVTGTRHTCAIANTGTVYCWGYNLMGELGTSTNLGSRTPTPQAVPFPAGVTSFSSVSLGGYHTCGVANTGQVYCWGYNGQGAYGNGTTSTSPNSTPTATLMP